MATRYEEALEAVAGLDAYLSVKATALGFSTQLAAPLAGRGMRLHFDATAPETVDDTFAVIEQLEGECGCTLPGRWRRSDDDAGRALELGLAVRVVKGQWQGPDERDHRAGFLSVVDRLAGRARDVAVASHDRPLAAEALRRLRAAGTPCELEQLYGLPLAPPPARVYVPYGHGYLPYALRRLRRNPRIALWVARDLVLGR